MRYAHLSAGFMLTSIVGLILSVYFVWNISLSWGFTFTLFFAMMFVASIISMTKADFTDKEIQQELAIHEKPLYKRKKNHIFK
ncbi:MAG: hypothetical protein ACP5OA_03575 [Candidatus Woesearchaeota archaeon]